MCQLWVSDPLSVCLTGGSLCPSHTQALFLKPLKEEGSQTDITSFTTFTVKKLYHRRHSHLRGGSLSGRAVRNRAHMVGFEDSDGQEAELWGDMEAVVGLLVVLLGACHGELWNFNTLLLVFILFQWDQL